MSTTAFLHFTTGQTLFRRGEVPAYNTPNPKEESLRIGSQR
jgi:hypothetical protein